MITDRENLKDQLEAMKMAQSNLPEFLGFIGKLTRLWS